MTQVFISHSSQDQAATESVRDRLKDAGYGALFVDFDDLRAGRRWERELYAELRRSDAVVFLASTASVTSRWCFAELILARALGKPVFPVRVELGASMPLLDDKEWVDFARDGQHALERLQAGLADVTNGPGPILTWDDSRSPYPGLAPFSSSDAGVFFARDKEIERLVELLRPTLWRRTGRFIAIVGPSGSGKSSLLRAGVLPRVSRRDGNWVVLTPLRPDSDPLARLARSITDAFAEQGEELSIGTVTAQLKQANGLAGLCRQLSALAGRPDAERPNVLVVIDQAEELLTLTGPEDQHEFLRILGDACNESSPVWVIATIRSEFLTRDPDRAGIAQAVDDVVLVEPLSRSGLFEVISRPARRARLDIDPELVARMVDDTAGGDALPLLAYTLSELYQRRETDGRIDANAYTEVGGVIGALEKRANQILAELTRQKLGHLALPTLLKFTAVERRGVPTRRTVDRRTLTASERAVVDAFVSARLLTSTTGDTGELRPDATVDDRSAMIDVTHEALLRQWPPLRVAIDLARTWLEQRSELDRLAADWESGRRDSAFLLRGVRLAEVDRWVAAHHDDLTELVHDFLDASRSLAARELEEAHQQARRWRKAFRGIAFLLVVAIAALSTAWYQQGQAQAQSDLAWARQLASQSDRFAVAQPDIAILSGLQSLSLGRGHGVAPPAGLVAGLARLNHTSRLLVGHRGPVNAVAITPDGTILATASDDQTVRLWDAATGQPRGMPLTGHTGPVTGVAFSPDAATFATSSADTTMRLWETATGRPHGAPLTGHTGPVTAVAFSPDGATIATSSTDTTVRLWDVATALPKGAPLVGHTAPVQAVAFSPDGRLLASAGVDNTARLWDPSGGPSPMPPLAGHGATIRALTFSPDSRVLATASDDSSVRQWDTGTGAAVGRPLVGHTNWVQAVAFSPDGHLIATASSDTTVRLWDSASGRPVGMPLNGHANRANSTAFTPDGRVLVSGSDDQTVRMWEVAEAFTLSRPLTGHHDGLRDVAFSPDGGILASASHDRTVRLWDVATGEPLGEPLTGHEGPVAGVAFSPDGALLATASWDGSLRLWDTSGRPHGPPLRGHTGRVDGVMFSPDGRTLASGSADNTVRLWDVARGEPLGHALTGHTASVRDVAFSPDGRLVASASDDLTVRTWDTATGAPHGAPMVGHTNWVNGVAFSPDGSLLASTSDDLTVRLWDTATGAPRGPPLTGHTNWVRGVAFALDGSLLATAGHDETVRLWDPRTGQPVGQPLRGHTGPIRGVAFSSRGQLATAGGERDNTVRLWDTSFDTWVTSGCALVGRNLSVAEWTSLAPGLPYQRTCDAHPAGDGAPQDAPAAMYAD